MAYVALYRAYRPQKFCDVVGQQHIIKTLQNAIKMNKVAHAYLFCGPRGTGKTTLAKIMAKALNCEHGPSVEPCDECDICQGIQKGMVPDVIEIDAASNNGADDIRALRDSVKYLPSVGRYKVYIIDEVHMLSNAAFNALLKTLEEPPKHVVFILATTEPYKLPNTILSRCQRFDFQSISIEDILKRLKIVAEAEKINMTEEAFNQIASSAEGGMRDALSLFDQTISYSVNDPITLDDVLAVSGNISYQKIEMLLSNCSTGNATEALKLLDGILKEGKEVPRVINDTMMFLRDVLLYKNNAILDDRLEYHQEDFQAFANKTAKPLIYSWLDLLNETNNNMRFSNQKRAFLELAILKMSDVKLNEEYDLLERVDRLEQLVNMLSTAPQKTVEAPKTVEVKLPTEEEINQLKEDIKQQVTPEPPKELNHDEVQTSEIELILNSASKSRKQELQAIFQQIEQDYAGVFIAQILVAGDLVAVNDNSFIVILNDLGFCNRLMRYENYQKLMEILDNYHSNITDYICLPKKVWNTIKLDYKSKYTTSNPKVTLNPIQTGVLKRKNPDSLESQKKDEVEQVLENLVDKEKLTIVED